MTLKNIRKHFRKIKRQIVKGIWWIKYRTTHRYHKIWTGLEPGWYDVSESMLHANFQMLVDFVEIEKASMEQTSNYFKLINKNFFTRYQKRSEKDGMAYLEWEISLGDEARAQSESAKEILMLYKWWKYQRPIRKKIVRSKFPRNATLPNVWSDNRQSDYWHAQYILDNTYDMIDQSMLIRLIKIRQHLWT